MKRRSNGIRLLAALLATAALVLSLAKWTAAQGAPASVKALVDPDHNALITRQRTMQMGSTEFTVGNFHGTHGTVMSQRTVPTLWNGTTSAGSDLTTGLSAFKADLEMPKDAPSDASASFYSTVGGQSALLLGNFKVPLPPGSMVAVNGDGKAQITRNVGHVDTNLALTLPQDAQRKPPFTLLSLDGSGTTDYQSFQGKANFKLGAPNIQERVKNLRKIKLTLTEAATGKEGTDVTTTLEAHAEVDARSPLAQMIQQVGSNSKAYADMLRQKLGMLQVESVEITRAEVKGDTGTFAMTVKAHGLRDTLKVLANVGLSRLPSADIVALRDSINSVLALQIDRLEITADFAKDGATGSLEAAGKHLDKFMEGYLQLVTRIQEGALKQQEARLQGNQSAAFAMKWASAVQRNMTALNLREYQALASSGAQVDQSFGVSVAPGDRQIQIQLNLKSDTSNVDRVLARLKAAGLPVMDRVGALFHVKTEGGQVSGSFYANGSGADPADVIRMLFVAPAQQDPDLKPTADVLAAIQLKDSVVSGQIRNHKLDVTGYSETSDLTAATRAIMGQVAPSLRGTADGVRLEVSASDGKATTTARFHFKEFMPGKTEAEVRDVLSRLFGSPVEVQLNADPARVALAPPLVKPAVAMPAELAAIKVQDEATLFATGAIPGLSGALSGKGAVLAIAAGALVLIAIAVAASRRKPTQG